MSRCGGRLADGSGHRHVGGLPCLGLGELLDRASSTRPGQPDWSAARTSPARGASSLAQGGRGPAAWHRTQFRMMAIWWPCWFASGSAGLVTVPRRLAVGRCRERLARNRLDEPQAHELASELELQYDAHGPRTPDSVRRVQPRRPVDQAVWQTGGVLEAWVQQGEDWFGRVHGMAGDLLWFLPPTCGPRKKPAADDVRVAPIAAAAELVKRMTRGRVPAVTVRGG
jgi:hypothetical protein